ncbi:MAG: PEP-CTERM sorting domain-containing protein [Nitrospirae bacterium]|nr:PEP-CTERM sorting domain-containing protein [Nitrospirota bacterium]
MKKILVSIAGILMAVLVMAGSATASIIGGPSPISGFGNDNGTELFVPEQSVLNLELYDFGSISTGSAFGFYFQGTDVNTAANRITIFDSGDETMADNLQYASINFNTGVVYDLDAPGVQSMFTPLGKDIGFFFSILGDQIYTQSILNGDLDLSATFPSLTDPATYLIGFESKQGVTLALEVTKGIKPVPEPSSMLLLVSGLVGLAFFRKRMRHHPRG